MVRLYIKYDNKELSGRTSICEMHGTDYEKSFKKLCSYGWEKWARPVLIHYEIYKKNDKINLPDENIFNK